MSVSHRQPGPPAPLPRLSLFAPLAAGLAALALAATGLAAAGLGFHVDRGISLTGTLLAPEATTAIAHGAGGTIARIHVREGDPVAAGDLVVTLDRTELDGQIASLVSRAGEARAQIAATGAEARALLERIDDAEGGHEPHVEDLERQVRGLRRDVAALEARILLAEQQLAHTEVRSPRDGRLVALAAVTPGDVVAPGAILAEVAPPDAPVAIEGRISAALTGAVAPGQAAKAWLTGLYRRELFPLEARVAAVAPEGIDDGRVGLAFHKVRIELAAARAELERRSVLRPGLRVEVMVPTGARPLIAHMLDPVRRNLVPALRRAPQE